MAVAALSRRLTWSLRRRSPASSADSQDLGPTIDRIREACPSFDDDQQQQVPDCQETASALVTVRCGNTYILRRLGDSPPSRTPSRTASKEKPAASFLPLQARSDGSSSTADEPDLTSDEMGTTVGDFSTTGAASGVTDEDVGYAVAAAPVASSPNGCILSEETEQSLDDKEAYFETEPVSVPVRVMQNIRGKCETTPGATSSSVHVRPAHTSDAGCMSCGLSYLGDAFSADTRTRVMSVMPGSLLLCTENTAGMEDIETDSPRRNRRTDSHLEMQEMWKPCISAL
eukprot:TRINITY_DN93819_c0_g1_i1.p1 TRINITY_DN93819_c0_g1~~TRINITY_DN93819_c0_g1_i1.p1  ORF type:complete len:286 (+),score=28.73 TRINITY_DN93819_c0_g1_i1:60-917(+)